MGEAPAAATGQARVDGPRACRPEELGQVIGLVDAAMRDGIDQTMRTDYPLVYAPDNLVNVSVVAVDGRLVSTAPVLPRRVAGEGYAYNLGIISPTATDPAHQHHGYGASCVLRSIDRMAALGIELSMLWTAIPTFPFYELNGYHAVRPDVEVVELRSSDAPSFESGDWAIDELDPTDAGRLAEIRTIHESDGPGVRRRPTDDAPLYSLPRMRTLLALDGGRGRVAAYLVDSRAINKPGLIEGGGEEGALAALVGRALAERDRDEAVPVPMRRVPHRLHEVVTAVPGRAPHEEGNPMVRINDVRALFEAIAPWLGLQAGPSRPPLSVEVVDAGELVSLEFTGDAVRVGHARQLEHIAITRGELTGVIFGAHPARPVSIPEPLAGLFPLPLPIGTLDHS